MINVKKEYIAPDLCFESFALSQSIAAGCSDVGKKFVIDDNAAGYFTNSGDSRLSYPCTYVWSDEDETYCYWDGTDSYKLFLS